MQSQILNPPVSTSLEETWRKRKRERNQISDPGSDILPKSFRKALKRRPSSPFSSLPQNPTTLHPRENQKEAYKYCRIGK
jgi:hypothetical protein